MSKIWKYSLISRIAKNDIISQKPFETEWTIRYFQPILLYINI
jgi:hypothetical protein